MSDIEQQINNIDDSIRRYSIEIEGLIRQLRVTPNTIQQNSKRKTLLKNIKLREEQIKKLEGSVNILKNTQRQIDTSKRINSAFNRNTIRDEDVSSDAKKIGIKINTPEEREEEETEEEELERLMQENKSKQQNILSNDPSLSTIIPFNPPYKAQKVSALQMNQSVPAQKAQMNPSVPAQKAPALQMNLSAPAQKPQKAQINPSVPPQKPQINQSNNNLSSGNQKNRRGFTETIVRKGNIPIGPQRPNLTLCPTLFNTGNRVNEKYFIPSQFPNITKIKPIVIEKKTKTKGGGKSCKNNKGKIIKYIRKSKRNNKRMF
jgi:hypothetical protein